MKNDIKPSEEKWAWTKTLLEVQDYKTIKFPDIFVIAS